jgi:acylphosphatase
VKSVRVRVTGRVQGVWFRGWAAEMAQSRGLKGWVRNRRDGSVEALFSGSGDAVTEMVEDCRRGPPAARVDALVQEDAEAPAESEFRQLPTE